MIKKLVVCVLLVATVSGCNYQVIDTQYKYDTAIVSLPNGTVISGELESWRDYEDGDQIQVKINGTTYLIHSSQVALIG